MRNEIRELQLRLGITMLFVTHDQTEAMSMADRIILMRDGKIEQSGAPADLYERPASTFVARFIGTPPMNVIDLVAGDGGLVVAGTTDAVVAHAGARTAQLGVRPEHIVFAETGLAVTVERTEYFGADTITACRAGTQLLVVRTPGRPALTQGTTAHLRWPGSAAHLFDSTTGLRRDAPQQQLTPDAA